MEKLIVHKTAVRKTWAWLFVAIMIVTLAIPTGMNAIAGDSSITITESAGWLESAYVEWSPVTNATGYSVYCKSETASDSSYIKLDDMLIRKYDTYYRADAVGLKAGNYVLKVVPILNGSENLSKAAVTSILTVSALIREGFAFSSESNAKTASGGYNDDGTVASNALILYVTETNKNTLTQSVKTGSNKITNCTGIGAILAAWSKGFETRPLIIRVIGKVTKFNGPNTNYLQLKEVKNVTVEGIGEDATAFGWGVFIRTCTNIEVRNIGFMMFPDDGVSIDTDNNNIWIHNNDLFYGAPGSDADQVKGDGSCDMKKFSNFITVSYNHFWDSGKCILCGLKESNEFFVTFHHNWYDHSDSRQPRIRKGTVHIYNNYFDGNSKYGVGVTLASSAFVENNYFRNCAHPMLSSLQGSDIYGGEKGTFSKEAGGMIKAYGNTIMGATRFVDQTYSSTDFDAITVSSRDEIVPNSYKTVVGGSTYNNFDTALTMYKYSVDSPELAKAKVEKYAGRINGGDFKWEFNDAIDDSLDEVNAALKSAIVDYTSKLVSVGGNSAGIPESTTQNEQPTTQAPTQQPTTQAPTQQPTTQEPTQQPTTQAPTQQPTTQVPTQQPTTQAPTHSTTIREEHNFTTSGKDSSFYKINGNLSTSKGTVTYNGLKLTRCLRMESITYIKFNAASAGQLKLVFIEPSANVNINGVKYTATNGILTVSLNAGAVSITRTATYHMYYILFTSDGSTEPTTQAPTEPTTQTPTEPTTQTPTQPTKQIPTQTPTQPTTQEPTQPTEAPTQQESYDLNSTGVVTNLSKMSDSQYKTVVYCAPNASSTGEGTSNSPMSLESAISLSNTTDGIAILLKEGTYSFNTQLTIPFGNNGSSSEYKVLKAATGAKVTLDFSSQPYGDVTTNARGLQIEGNYWYVNGITIYGAADNGMFIGGSNNVIERCILRANRDSGLQISRRKSNLSNMADWPSNNYIINCTSYDNMDPATNENADGFAAKLTCGPGNVFDGCISYCNIDDGWDLYAKTATGSIGVVTIRNCVAFNNGTLTNGTTSKNGDRNGFKLGGSNGAVPTPHIVFNCMAFNNGKDGFTDNGNGGALNISNCTSHNNEKGNFNFYRTNEGSYTNLLTITAKNADKFVGTIENSVYYNGRYYQVQGKTAVTNGLKIGTVITGPESSDLFSMTAPDVKADIDSLYRNADGSVTTDGYLITKSSSSFSSLGAKFGVSTSTLKLTVLTK